MRGLNEVVGLCRMLRPNEIKVFKMYALNEMVGMYVVLDA